MEIEVQPKKSRLSEITDVFVKTMVATTAVVVTLHVIGEIGRAFAGPESNTDADE